jgi:hypothetical protein
MPKFPLYEFIRGKAMEFIKVNHPETAQFMNNSTWIGGRQDTKLVGAEKYVYESQGWKVTVSYPVIPNPTYTISAEYTSRSTSGSMGIPYSVTWEGTYQNDAVTETNYVFAQ